MASKKIYVLYNKEHKIEIKCTEERLDDWIKRGFKIINIIENSRNKMFDLSDE